MPTPIKPTCAKTGVITKEQESRRKEAEQKLKGQADKIKPPSYLTQNQKKIFKFIVSEMEASGILNNLDLYILIEACIAIDGMQQVDIEINNDPDYLKNPDKIKSLSVLKVKYLNSFYKCVSELCLSPQSRAKLALTNVNAQQQAEDEVLKALRGDDVE